MARIPTAAERLAAGKSLAEQLDILEDILLGRVITGDMALAADVVWRARQIVMAHDQPPAVQDPVDASG